MASTDFDVIFAALQQAKVRYLVAGGVAVLLHGHLRFTADVDIVLDLDDKNVLAALVALAGLGYRPRAPVAAEQFADRLVRRRWIEEKGLVVFSLWSPEHPATEVDIFVDEPFPFAEARARAEVVDLDGVEVAVTSIPDLIALKQRAGRPKDLDDIRALEALQQEPADD